MKFPAFLIFVLTFALAAQAKIVTRDVAYEHAGVKLSG